LKYFNKNYCFVGILPWSWIGDMCIIVTEFKKDGERR